MGGFFIRYLACSLAARALRATDIGEGYAPRIWSLAVFFENYLCGGADATRADFGPKEPAVLAEVSPNGEAA